MKPLLLRLLVVAGIAVNIGFLLINLRPTRPHLSKRRHAKILLRADPPRAKWVKENELDEFGATHDVDFEVVTAHTFEEVLAMLKAERDKPTGLALAAIDDATAEEIRLEKAVRPFASVVEADELDDTISDYIPEAVSAGRGPDGQLWFLPKRAEVNVAVFLNPAIEEAYLHWDEDRAAIQAALAQANGVGLPKGYTLEKRPDAWDSYDLFVAGWYWAHHPAAWADGTIAPRLGLRTGASEDAMNDLVGSFFAHGLRHREVGKLDAPAVADALQWQALFRKHHLLAAECEAPEGIDSDGVNELFKARRLAWAPINQEDSLWLHGGSQRIAPPGMANPQELGWATLPCGASLELSDGKPARTGRTWSFRYVHFWALPIHSPDPGLAFEIARFVEQRGLQQRETEAQGLLPIRQDLRQDYPILFRLDWMQRILDASYHQIDRGSGPMPPEVASKGYDDAYAALREAVVRRGADAPVTLPAIVETIRAAAKDHDATGGASHGQ